MKNHMFFFRWLGEELKLFPMFSLLTVIKQKGQVNPDLNFNWNSSINHGQ